MKSIARTGWSAGLPGSRLVASVCLLWVNGAVAGICGTGAGAINGTEGDDVLIGGPGAEIFRGLGGNDRIEGGGGNDVICGGPGDDILIGGDGADILLGGPGSDSCTGGPGADGAAECEDPSAIEAGFRPVTLFSPDGARLDGAVHFPLDGEVRGALVATHGRLGAFYSHYAGFAGPLAAQRGYLTVSVNRRDGRSALNYTFEQALGDLEAPVRLVRELGVDRLLLSGHSLGSLWAGSYPLLGLDPQPDAVALLGAVEAQAVLLRADLGDDVVDGLINDAGDLVAEGRGDELIFWEVPGRPDASTSATPNHLLSFYGPDAESDLRLSVPQLDVPLFLLRAEGDGATPDSISRAVLAAATQGGVDAEYTVLPFSGTSAQAHLFEGLEWEAVKALLDWFEGRAGLAPPQTLDLPAQVADSNFVPVASVVPLPEASDSGTELMLDGSGSRDLDGQIASVRWRQVSGPGVSINDPTSLRTSVTLPSSPGVYGFELEVVDDRDATSVAEVATRVSATSGAAADGGSDSGGGGGAVSPSLALMLLTLALVYRVAMRRNRYARERQPFPR